MCISWCADYMTLRNARCDDKDISIYFTPTFSTQPGLYQVIHAFKGKITNVYIKQYIQCTYNITLRRVRATNVVVK